MNGKVVIAVNARDLFDDVRLHGDVLGRTPRGNHHVKHAVFFPDGKAEALERLDDGAVVDLNAGVAVNKGLVKVQLHGVIAERSFIGECRHDLHLVVIFL